MSELSLRSEQTQQRGGFLWFQRRTFLALVVLITAVGLLLRIVNLTSIPTGLHGDEAIVGMEGQRILREVLIDPYSPSALGQPTAPFYLAALTVWIWDNTVFAVRISAVIFGTLAIPALYLVVRRSLGVPIALLSATFLATLGWHIHYSRIAFPLPSWPLWVMLTVGAIVQATRSQSIWWWSIAGAMSGGGIYVYNAHPLALAILCGFVGVYLVHRHSIVSALGGHREPRLQAGEGGRANAGQGESGVGRAVQSGGAFYGALLGSLLPMLWFIRNNTEMYWNSITRHSVRDTAEWQQLDGPIAQAGFVLEQYARFWWELSFAPRVDYVDATGITVVVPFVLLAMALGGMMAALSRYRGPLVWVGALLVVLMPFATVLTEQGEMRRTLVIAPFLAMFMAIGVVELVRVARSHQSVVTGWVVLTGFTLLIGASVTADLRNYFYVHGESSTQHWVFAESFYDASMFLQDLPEDNYVYFMSDRWSIDYEPRRFLAPDARGEDRSDEFGRFELDVDPDVGRPVFVLLGEYRMVLDALQEMYPDGEVVTGSRNGRPSFIAYVLPEE